MTTDDTTDDADGTTADPCPTCDGSGQLADTDNREPWTAWTALPVHSAVAVDLGIVKPIPCDACEGSGRRTPTEEPTT